MGGWTAWDGRADKQKAPSVFISVTFGCSVIALLHAKQRASAAEGRAGKKKEKERNSDGKSNWPESAPNVCIHRHPTDGSGNKVRVGRALIKKERERPRLE